MKSFNMRVKKGLENLVYLFILLHPKTDADMLYDSWKSNKIFGEYNRPSRDILRLWFIDIQEGLEDQGIALN